ncbi:MAG: LysM peptidoglycan-binding domain-containing protein [Thermoguttaceae bacterium]|jgi:hypothetical protein|nr:LysM peptidoglycan-binding domain-containing protein [Thermoguttaceae bacterium]
MNSLKTAVVVTVLLGVMYGVYTTLTSQPGAPPPDGSGGQWPSLSVRMPAGVSKDKEKAPWEVSDSKTASAPSWPPGRRAAEPADSTAQASPSSKAPFTPPANPFAKTSEKTATPPEGPRFNTPSLPSPSNRTPQGAEGPTARLTPSEIRPEFTAMMDTARRKLDAGELAEVLLELSPLYGNPDLTPEESRQLTELLDQLAGTVIYSRQHLLEAPYVVRPGDTLEQIAAAYDVPWQLLAKINGIRSPGNLAPGRQLKVLRGPFEATVCLDRYELVLSVGGRYAGRFPIGVGRDQPQLEGTYTVREKLPGRPYHGRDGEFAAEDPRNPLGRLWIGLDGPVGIHGTDDPENIRRTTPHGNICLRDRDIEDVYDILSCGSRVTIRR